MTQRLGAERALTLALGPELLDAIARRAAAIVADELVAQPEPFLNVNQAAEHLACKPQRVYDLVHRRAIPFYKDGSRLLFRRAELDDWLATQRSPRS